MKNLRLVGLIFLIILTTRCSVQQRRYSSGLHVEWRNRVASPLAQKDGAGKRLSQSDDRIPLQSVEALSASASKSDLGFQVATTLATVIYKDSLCDLVMLRNGQEIHAKVLEISETEIKYILCNSADARLFVVKKPEVFMIKYINGTKEVIPEQPQVTATDSRSGSMAPASQKIHPAAFASFFLMIVGILIPLLAFSFIASFPGIGAVALIAALSVLLFIASVITGVVALYFIQKRPERWRGRSLAFIGLLISGIVGLLMLLTFSGTFFL